MPTRRRLRERAPDSRSIDPTSRSTYGFCQGDRDSRWWRVQSRSALTVIAPFGSLWTRTVQGRQQTSQSCTSTDSPGSKSAGSISTPPGSPQNGHSTWKPDLSIQGRSAEKTPRAPQRMMPAIKTTRATFIRRVRPTGFPPLGPSPARTTPTTRSTVSPSQTREFTGTPLSVQDQLAVLDKFARCQRARRFTSQSDRRQCDHLRCRLDRSSCRQLWRARPVRFPLRCRANGRLCRDSRSC